MPKKKQQKTLQPKAVPPTKSSSGEGFAIEDRVAALCAANLLLGRAALSQLPGRLTRIEFQVAADGWTAFNDLLLTFEDTAGSYRAAVSIRSKKEITANGFSTDVKTGLVTQFTKAAPNPFNPARDRLVLVAAEHGHEVATAVRALTAAARGHPTLLPTRIKEPGFTNDVVRALFKNLEMYCAWEGANAVSAAQLLGVFVLDELPLGSLAQPDPESGLALSRELLRNPNPATVLALWEALSSECRKQKQAPGYLDVPRLLEALRSRFQLKAYPYDISDWARLEADSRGLLDQVRDDIVGYRLPRQQQLDTLAADVTTHPVTVLVGVSGTGKTSLSKRFFEENPAGFAHRLWTRVQSWPRPASGALAAALGLPALTHDLGDLFARVNGPALLVVDGVEHCSDGERVATLARVLRIATQAGSPWRVILLARAEEWSGVRDQLAIAARGITIHPTPLSDFSAEELRTLTTQFPELRPLALQPHLTILLRKPKIVALVTEHLHAGGALDPKNLTGESHLARWFWQDRVRRGDHSILRVRAARFLAEQQAESVQPEIPETAFETALLPICNELVADGIIVARQGKFTFQHDLFADWARLEILIAEGANWPAFAAPRVVAPHWHRAVRLYGVWLLEQAVDGPAQWAAQVTQLHTGDAAAQLLADLLLEAPVFSAAPQENLEKAWPRLIENKGVLLRRMFGRIRLSATAPDEVTIDRVHGEGIARDYLVSHFRVPYPQYWLPLLRVLHAHLDDALNCAALDVARIVQSWLDFTQVGWRGRVEAAELAVTNAERIVAEAAKSRQPHRYSREFEQPIFQAAMAAMPDHPERVRVLLRKLAGLIPADGRAAFPKETWIIRSIGLLRGPGIKYKLPKPWPGGPHDEPNRSFLHLILHTAALVPVMRVDPALAREVALAVCIAPPDVEDSSYHSDHHELREIAYDESHQSPFYTRGPFLALCQASPKEGMVFIVALVNFFTERWLAREKRRGATPSPILVAGAVGPESWLGDHRLYFAYRDAPTVNHFVVSALVALEKWLCDRIEKGEDVEADIASLLTQSKSLALAGVLIAVGKARPELLFSVLWPLVAAPEIQAIEFYCSRSGFGIRPRLNTTLWESTLIAKWEQLAQHRMDLREVCRQLLAYPECRAKLATMAAQWKRALQQPRALKVDATFVRETAELLDPANWKPKEGGTELHFHAPPDLLAAASERQAKAQANLSLLSIPIDCRSLLDKGETLPDSELEKWFAALDQLPKEPVVDDDQRSTIASLADSQCGIVAVLVHCGAAWLKKFPEKSTRLRALILGHLANPPAPRRFMHDDTPTDHTWENFAAEVAPFFLAEDPSSLVWREAVAELAGRPHLQTVRILFRRAFAVRNRLGDSFTQLCHLAIWVAAARQILNVSEYEKTKPLDWGTWWPPQRAAFVGGKVAVPPVEWESIEIIAPKTFPRHENRTWANIDLAVVVAALDWLRPLILAAAATERSRWLGWAKSLMASIVATIPRRANDRERSPLPSGDENQAITFLGRLLAGFPSAECRPFWEPMFGLGEIASHYIRYFLHAFFFEALQSTAPNFSAAWEEMLAWAWAAPKWEGENAQRAHELRELWWTLLLIDSGAQTGLEAKHAPFIEAKRSHYAKWATIDLEDTWSAQRFLAFLRQPAVEPLLAEGIIWLDNRIDRDPKRRWRRDDLRPHLSEFVVWAWAKHEVRLRANAAAFAAFKQLLVLLAADQDQLALALLSRIGGG